MLDLMLRYIEIVDDELIPLTEWINLRTSTISEVNTIAANIVAEHPHYCAQYKNQLRKYTKKERFEAAKLVYDKKYSREKVAKIYDVNPYTVRDWYREYKAEVEFELKEVNK